uniref:Uncharacterized protein n=1 Tax=Arundo donax TaxID=35708 RepID=A0A0A9HGI9_ARUDO
MILVVCFAGLDRSYVVWNVCTVTVRSRSISCVMVMGAHLS